MAYNLLNLCMFFFQNKKQYNSNEQRIVTEVYTHIRTINFNALNFEV